jgi:predicted RNA-binding Zn ribbon-like protein
MNEAARTLDTLDQVGGHPVLDFVNTVNAWHGDEPGEEFLHTYDDVLRWHRMAGLIGKHGTRALKAKSSRAESRALRGVREFRQSLHAVFHAVAAGRPLPQAALDRLSEAIRKTANWRRLTARGNQIVCGWDFAGAPPDAIVGPIAWQAVELLEHGELHRIKECPLQEGCGWLFFDASRNRSRAWCSMKTCGNSAKVKRFRARRET